MILQQLTLKKGKDVAGHRIQSWMKRRRRYMQTYEDCTRSFTTCGSSRRQMKDELAKENVKDLSNKEKAKRRARALDRDFFMSILGSSATKREARSYLQRFTASDTVSSKAHSKPEKSVQKSDGSGVNLGSFYGTTRAAAESPKFVQGPERLVSAVVGPPLHVALVKIRSPQDLDDEVLNGFGRTLSQLGRLGLTSAVVIDCNAIDDNHASDWKTLAVEQANRVISAIDTHGGGARLIDNLIGVSEKEADFAAYVKGKTHITLRKLLMTPLRRGVIPVIPAVGYTDSTLTAVPVNAGDVVLALTRELAGLLPANVPDEDPITTRERLQALRNEVSLDRLIILDPLGGVPASDRPNGYHVFLNMEQEFEAAKQDLLQEGQPHGAMSLKAPTHDKPVTDLGMSNPFSRFVETEFTGAKPPNATSPLRGDGRDSSQQRNIHLDNLELARNFLAVLPPSSSALLTTPQEAANSGKDIDGPFQAGGVGTRRQRNPLIHNLLTDKPVFSSSLPIRRLGSTVTAEDKEPATTYSNITPTTFAKHGMAVTIFPDPKTMPWQPPTPGEQTLSLTDSHVDLPRLVHLIDDSFNRKLDVRRYLKRIEGRVAGVIIAGQYEGGAILTWELPPGVPDDGSPKSRARMVPYLDKFAVLKKSQGSGGHADVVFKAMVRDCFPDGVCWRSRTTNPVNKWYFERSRGTWKLPGTAWTMFWTTPDLSMDQQMFLDYEAVCRGVLPTWADDKAVQD